jgi:hypothetical protein
MAIFSPFLSIALLRMGDTLRIKACYYNRCSKGQNLIVVPF